MSNESAIPQKRFRLSSLLPTLLIDVVAPIAIFKGLEAWGVPTLWALIGGGLAPAINSLRVWIATRRLEPLGLLIVAAMAIGTLASMVSGDPFYVLIKDSFLTGIFGFVFLVSLLTRRPLTFYIVRQFVAGEKASLNEQWDALWQYAEFRTANRLTTVAWGILFIIEALVRVALALRSTPDTVATVAPIIGFAVSITLIFLTRYIIRASRFRLEKRHGVIWPF